MSYKLDRARPLWELWFIDGVENDRVAILTKCTTRSSTACRVPGSVRSCSTRRPNRGLPRRSPRSLVGVGLPRFELRAIGGMFNLAVMTPYRMMRMVEQVVRQQLAAIGLANKPPRYFDAPTTRFNAPLSPHRRIVGAGSRWIESRLSRTRSV